MQKDSRDQAVETIPVVAIDIVTNPVSPQSHLVKSIPDPGLVGVLSWHIDDGILNANDTLLHMLGVTRDDLVAGKIDWTELTPPELRKHHLQTSANLFIAVKRVPFEKIHIRSDRSHLSVIVASSFDDGSQTTGFAFVIDITAQKTAEGEHKRLLGEQSGLLDQIAEAMTRQRQFVKETLAACTEGRLRLCYSVEELPVPLIQRGESVMLTPQTLRLFRQQVEAVAVELGMSENKTFDLVSGTGEGIMNAVRHGGGGTGRINVDIARSMVQVYIEDHGNGIREVDLHRATLEKGWSGGGSFGHGFYLMLRTVDRTFLLTGKNGTTVVLEQEAEPPQPTWVQGIL